MILITMRSRRLTTTSIATTTTVSSSFVVRCSIVLYILFIILITPIRKIYHHHYHGHDSSTSITSSSIISRMVLQSFTTIILLPGVNGQATGFCHRSSIKMSNPYDVIYDDDDSSTSTSTSSSTSSSSSSSSSYTSFRHRNVFVIAHRGASYHIPIEHSIPSYRLALELNSHYIESDIVISSDGIIIPMHNIDLTITTNILNSSFVINDKRQPWFLSSLNRTSYWTFNFTFNEIQQLQLITSNNNNNVLSVPRTSIYDHKFNVPSLSDVIHVLNDWNINDIPKIHANYTIQSDINIDAANHLPTYYDRYKSGIYIEFKYSNIIYEQTGYNIVQLLFDQIKNDLVNTNNDNNDVDNNNDNNMINQKYNFKDLLSCYERVRFDEYIIPPIILQSFNISDLYTFHNLWHTTILENYNDPTTITNQLSTIAPEPMYILLVDEPYCYEDTFWYMIRNDQYRSFINGIGMNKNCLLLSYTIQNMKHMNITLEEQNDIIDTKKEQIAAIQQRISELQLVLHIWTIRPEISYLSSSSSLDTSSTTNSDHNNNNDHTFHTVMDEIRYLLCNVSHVHGIFTESVDYVIRALQVPCSNTNTNNQNSPIKTTNENCSTNNKNSNSSDTSLILSILISFIFGIIITILINRLHQYCIYQRNINKTNSYQQATTISNHENDIDLDENENDVVMNDNGHIKNNKLQQLSIT